MREIVSPLSSIRSPFGARRNPLAAYAAAGFTPKLVAAFADEFYAKEGRKSTFGGVLEPTATTNGTMVDSDGLLKWRPHNLLTYSEDLTQSWTATGTSTIDDASTVSLFGSDAITSAFVNTSVGSGYTVEAELWTDTDVGGQVDIGFNTNNLSNTFSAPITLSSTPTKYLFSKSTNTATQNGFRLRNVGGTAKTVKISKVRLFRSDLGGMVNNPDTGDSYVPTTTSAVYMARRGHHIYNGSAWVDEGVLIEPETRTNLVTYSQDFTDVSWTKTQVSVTAFASDSPLGTSSGSLLTSTTGTACYLRFTTPKTTATAYTMSIFAKAGTANVAYLRDLSQVAQPSVYFDLSSGIVGTEESGITGEIEDCENGWYRLSATATSGDPINNDLIDFGFADADGSRTCSDGKTGYLDGAQLEVGSTPSSYIPTSGSQVARAGEQLVLPHENISWPEPKVIGPELVTNGTFDTDSDWTKGTGVTIGAGVATWSASTGNLSQNIVIEAGKVYAVSFDVSGFSSGGVVPRFTGGSPVIGQTVNSNGSYTQFLVAVSDETLRFDANGTTSLSIDNISVREIEPLALSIHMQGRMTYADEDALRQQRLISWELNATNQIIWFLSTNSTNTGRIEVFQKNEGTTDTVNSGVTAYSPGINVPFNIASRHGSTFVNGAVDGVALTENTTPTALPDLETTDLQLAYSGGSMVIKEVSLWDVNITDAGTEDATS